MEFRCGTFLLIICFLAWKILNSVIYTLYFLPRDRWLFEDAAAGQIKTPVLTTQQAEATRIFLRAFGAGFSKDWRLGPFVGAGKN
jgi:hypothetical protein